STSSPDQPNQKPSRSSSGFLRATANPPAAGAPLGVRFETMIRPMTLPLTVEKCLNGGNVAKPPVVAERVEQFEDGRRTGKAVPGHGFPGAHFDAESPLCLGNGEAILVRPVVTHKQRRAPGERWLDEER